MPRRRSFTAEFKSQLVLKLTPALRACASVSCEQSAAELCLKVQRFAREPCPHLEQPGRDHLPRSAGRRTD